MAPQVDHSKFVFLCMSLSSTDVPRYRQLHCLEALVMSMSMLGLRLAVLLSSGRLMQQGLVVQASHSHKCSEVLFVEVLQLRLGTPCCSGQQAPSRLLAALCLRVEVLRCSG